MDTRTIFFTHRKEIFAHSFFIILSLYIIIANKTSLLSLIPSYFNNEITSWINFILSTVARLYILYIPLLMFIRIKSIRRAPIFGLAVIFFTYITILTTVLLIPGYEYMCNIILSRDIGLSEFGSFFAGITGLLAFGGVLISLHVSEKRADKVEKESRDRFTEDSERNIFFQLLELHTNKVNAVEFNGKRGAEAFKEFVDIANKNLNLLFMGKAIKMNCTDISKESMIDIYNNKRELFDMMKVVYKVYFNGSFHTSPLDKNIGIILSNTRNMMKEICNKKLSSDISRRYDDYSILKYIPETINEYSEHKYEYTKIVADFLYKKYGHIFGHYFRNMYYVMDTINNFSDRKNYKELFRAQLSRYELALGVFNAVSSNSSSKMIMLLEKFDIFKDVYPDDLTLLQSGTNDSSPQDIIKSMLQDFKNDHQNA